MINLIALLMLALVASEVHGYPVGAGNSACAGSNMVPGHGVDPQTTPAPYIIELSQNEYCPGEKINGMSGYLY